jgi:hypothetical protein
LLKIVQSLYEVDPSGSETIRSIVEMLFTSSDFGNFFEVNSIQDVKFQLDQVLGQLHEQNEFFKRSQASNAGEDPELWGKYDAFQRALQESIRT